MCLTLLTFGTLLTPYSVEQGHVCHHHGSDYAGCRNTVSNKSSVFESELECRSTSEGDEIKRALLKEEDDFAPIKLSAAETLLRPTVAATVLND